MNVTFGVIAHVWDVLNVIVSFHLWLITKTNVSTETYTDNPQS